MRHARRFGLFVCLLAFAGDSLAAQPATTNKQSNETRYIDVGGFKLRMVVAGSGSATVVFENGFGDGLEVWDDVLPDVSRFARIVAYDRAGTGKSEAAVQQRSFTQIARELHTLLQRGGIAPPYVMVGHSMGGATIRAFAALYRQEVAGLVFVDPLTERIFDVVTKQELDAEISRQEARVQNARPGVKAEWKLLKNTMLDHYSELRALGKPPDVPVMLLVAGRDRPPLWAKSVFEQYGNWMLEASEGGIAYTPDNSHYIQRDEPSLVVSAIRRVVFPSVRNTLARAIKDSGPSAVIALYRQMRTRYPAESFNERILNSLGYEELSAKHIEGAIALFKLNVEMYPNASNPYDSLGEAYMVHGDRELAIINYRKSLALDPNNTNAITMLEKLGSPRAQSK